ncbi:MAG TPA: c-type cytochrome [Roseomonas sp.]|jgi:cytochrome c2
MPSKRAKGIILTVVILLLLSASAGAYLVISSQQEAQARAAALTGGDPSRGQSLALQFGCGSCHIIPGVRGADRRVGPSLDGIAGQVYLAGVLTNTAENMVRWIEDPQAVDPKTAMPRTGAAGQDARDIAAYLYTLR